MAKTHAADLGLNDTLDFSFDWSEWLVPNDTIATSVWVLPSGLEQAHTAGKGDDSTLVWLKTAVGATVGTYSVLNQITTTGDDAPESEPRHTERTLVVNVVSY